MNEPVDGEARPEALLTDFEARVENFEELVATSIRTKITAPGITSVLSQEIEEITRFLGGDMGDFTEVIEAFKARIDVVNQRIGPRVPLVERSYQVRVLPNLRIACAWMSTCGKAFISEREVLEHMFAAHGAVIKCRLCDPDRVLFDEIGALRQHIIRRHIGNGRDIGLDDLAILLP